MPRGAKRGVIELDALIAFAGVVLGGILTTIVGHFQSKSADLRLQTQLAHDVQQRQNADVLAVKLESLNHVDAFIRIATSNRPAMIEALAMGNHIPQDLYYPVISALHRAETTMKGIGEEAVIVRQISAFDLLTKARGIDAVEKTVYEFSDALAALGYVASN